MHWASFHFYTIFAPGGHGGHGGYTDLVCLRAGWAASAYLWTVRRGEASCLLAAQDRKYNVWTDFAVSASQTDYNCRIWEAGGQLAVEVLRDVGEGELLVLDRDYSGDLLRELCLQDQPIDLSSPLLFSLHKQKELLSTSHLFLRYKLTAS